MEFHGGEEALVNLRYKRFFGYCRICYNLCHDHHKCPTKKEDQEEEKVYRDVTSGKHNACSSSYKGVVINGAMEVKDKDNGKISYHGKREENMYEKRESKWSRVADKDSRVSMIGETSLVEKMEYPIIRAHDT